MLHNESSMTQRTAIITLAGAPNAGKSTLLNALVGSKVSIVTPKVQTTRARVSGIVQSGESQLVFVDTPGIFKPKKTLDKSMVRAAWDGMNTADFNCLLVDAKKGLNEDVPPILAGMKNRDGKPILILNKIDLVEKHTLLALAAQCNEHLAFEQTFMVSAQKKEGVEDLKRYFAANAPEQPWMYPDDQLSDMPDRMFAAEITREKLMLALKQEIPYQLMVDTEKWEEKGKLVAIYQTIYVMTEGQKKIIVGKGGSMLKTIGEQARKELSHLMGKKVSVFLFVKVDPRWMDSPEHFRMQGLD